MIERESDSIEQIRPADAIILRQTTTGEDGEPTVKEERIARIPQWKQRFEESPILPEGVMIDTTHIDPATPDSHILVTAAELGKGVEHKVVIGTSGTGTTVLEEGKEIVVNAEVLSSSIQKRRTGTIRSGPDVSPRPSTGGKRRGW